jgi:FMN phosphatase YigB (HAD superfamily)
MKQPNQPVFWKDIDLVIFDLDGTLYSQRRLRTRMALNLLYVAVKTRSLKTLNVLRIYRQCRERLAEGAIVDFMNRQFDDTAMQCGCSAEEVREVVNEWIEQRPLTYLRSCRYSGIEGLFDALHRSGRTIAVFSDYSAAAKLEALSLKADIVVSATDGDVQRLKPDPAGLYKILNATGFEASRSLIIGDRFDRDWAAANRAGIPAIIKSRRGDPRCGTFRSYQDTLFQPVVQSANTGETVAFPSFEKCVRAVVDTLLCQELPLARKPENVEFIGTYVLAAHAAMPDYLRLAFRILTFVFDAWPYPTTGRPFHRLGPDHREDQVKRWQRSRLQIRSALIAFYRTFTIFGAYSEIYEQDVECEGNPKHD